MKAIVIYDSVFSNTEKVAEAIGKAIGGEGEKNVIKASDVSAAQLQGLDVLIVGSPTRGFRPTEGITKFLNSLPNDALRGIRVGAFDTRVDVKKIDNKFLSFMVGKMGYADAVIAKLMVKKGGQLLEPTAGFIVKESEGPLEEGELERAAEWAKELILK